MKMLARGYVYWTNINRDIEETVRHCRNCQEGAKMPKKTVLNSWTTEERPWDRIRIDYATEWKDVPCGSRCIFEVAGSLRNVVVVDDCYVKRTQNVVRTTWQPKRNRVRERNAVHSKGVPGIL
ncbi:hypothetical protein Aduo_002363 [Ancylostoma duodenale]